MNELFRLADVMEVRNLADMRDRGEGERERARERERERRTRTHTHTHTIFLAY